MVVNFPHVIRLCFLLNIYFFLLIVEFQYVNGYKIHNKKKSSAYLRQLVSATGNTETQLNEQTDSKNKGLGLLDSEKPGAELTDTEKNGIVDNVKQGTGLTDTGVLGAGITNTVVPGAGLPNNVVQGAGLTDSEKPGTGLTDTLGQGTGLTDTEKQEAGLKDTVQQGAGLTDTEKQGAEFTDTEKKDAEKLEAELSDIEKLDAELTDYENTNDKEGNITKLEKEIKNVELSSEKDDSEKSNKKSSRNCWSPVDASKINEDLEALEAKYASSKKDFENSLGVESFDKEMLTVLLQTRGTAIREVYRTSNPKTIPAGLNLGSHGILSLPTAILMFYRMKLRNSTNFRIDYLHNDVQNMALSVRISMNTLRLMGDYYSSSPAGVTSIMIYVPNHGILEIILGNVTYSMEGRLRILNNRLNVENVVSNINHTTLDLQHPNGSAIAIQKDLNIVDFIDKIKTDLDLWMRDYFNDYLMYHKLPIPVSTEFLAYDKKKSLILNEHIGRAIENIKKRIIDLGADETAVPKFKIITVDGLEFQLYFGALRGLDTIYRRSIATTSKNDSGRKIDVLVGFGNLMIEYKYRAKIPSSGVVTGSLILNSEELAFHMQLSLNSSAPSTVDINIDSIQVLKPEALTVEGAGGRVMANFKFILEHHVVALAKTTVSNSVQLLSSVTDCDPLYTKYTPNIDNTKNIIKMKGGGNKCLIFCIN